MKKNSKKILKPRMVKVDAPDQFDYKEVEVLKKFVTEQGKILARTRTGITAKQQRDLTRAIKRARMLALMPFSN